jgi:hypothetical protein
VTFPLPTALEYANRGWRIVPIRPGEKRPALQNWTVTASKDPQQITDWFTGPFADHGIGIATGPESGIFVLDVDITDTKAGDETLADLEEQYGRLPETLMSITGSGGWHLLFTYPTGQEIRNDAGRRHSQQHPNQYRHSQQHPNQYRHSQQHPNQYRYQYPY